MLRNALVAVSLLVVGGFVVALVNAQDSARRPLGISRPIRTNDGLSSVLKPADSAAPEDAVDPTSLAEPQTLPFDSPADTAGPAGAAGEVSETERGGLQSVLMQRLREQPAAPAGEELAGGAAPALDMPLEAPTAGAGDEEPGDASATSLGPPAFSATELSPPTDASPETAPQSAFRPRGAYSAEGTESAGSAIASEASTLAPPRAEQFPAPSRQPKIQTYSGGSRRVAARPRPSGAMTASSPSDRASGPEVAMLASEAPAIRIEAEGPAAITLGKEASYKVKAFNRGDKAAQGLIVHVALPRSLHVAGMETPAGTVERRTVGLDAGHLVWTIEELAAGDRAELDVKVVPQRPQPFQLGIEWSFRPIVAAAEVQVQEPKLDISISGPKDILYGETKVYTLTLTNPGTGDAENVSVTLGNSPTNGATKQLGRLAAGERRELDVELTAREAGTMEIQALALADGGLRSQAAIAVQVRRAQLAVEVSGPQRRFAGSTATYAVRVANVGDAVAEDVVAALSIPEGAQYQAGAAGASTRAGRIQWPVGLLNPGSDKVFHLQFDLTLPGANAFEARVLAAGDLAAADTAVTQVEALADLKLLVNDPRGPKSIGEEVVYEVTIMNRGTKAARNIAVVTQFSEGIEPVRADGVEAEVVPGQVLFQPIAQLGPGERVVLKVVAKADKEGNHVFRAEVNCGDPETRLVTEETTRYFASSVLGP